MRHFAAFVLAVLLPLQAVASPATDDILVIDVKGDVQVTSGGTTEGARAGTTLDLPAAIRTGRDGSIDLRQGDTTIGIGPETQLDFPAPAASGGAIDRVVQPRGNAYYNVGPRGNSRLRVETPFLVAVIKGTQFNVAVTPDSSTISLHEGRLEVLATESGIAAVELNAGEVAIRKSGENTIRVLQVKNGAASSRPSSSDGDGVTVATLVAPGNDDQAPELPDEGLPLADERDELFGPGDPSAPTSPADSGLTVDAVGGIDDLVGAPVGADVGLDTMLDLGAGTVDATVDVGLDIGAVDADVAADVGVDLGAGTIDANVDIGVDLGPANVDTGVEVGVDLGAGTVDASVDTGVDLGAAGADVAADAGVDLGAGTADVGVDAGVDLGGVEADVGADVAADAGAGTIDAEVAADVVGADVGVDVGVDLAGSDAGLDVGIDVLGVDIDLGLGGRGPANDDAGASDGGESGGLLGGILRRPRP